MRSGREGSYEGIQPVSAYAGVAVLYSPPAVRTSLRFLSGESRFRNDMNTN